MKNRRLLLGNSGGWTLVELVLTVAILLILMAIIAASYETVKARVRNSEARANMDSIAQAAYTDYAYNGVWDVLTFNGMPPSIAAEGLLSHWPTRGPCPGWYYSWENWDDFDIRAVRVTLRRADNGVVWSYCVYTFGGTDCSPIDPITNAVPREISVNPTNYLYCDE